MKFSKAKLEADCLRETLEKLDDLQYLESMFRVSMEIHEKANEVYDHLYKMLEKRDKELIADHKQLIYETNNR